VSMVMNFWVP